jgi:hypothetical protein
MIITGVAAVLITFAIIIIIKELHLLPADMGILIIQDEAAPTGAVNINPETVQNDNPQNDSQQGTDQQKDVPKNSETQNSSEGAASPTTEEPASTLTLQEETQMFHYEELTQEIKDRITGVSYGVDCDVPYEELRYVNVLYWGFDGETHTGELIVNKAIAQDIVDIFKELYDQQYPIEQMVLVDEYDADDNASMAADNTSAFNYRLVDNGSGHLSLHSYGLAIDINPLYNPYIREVDGETVISPEAGAEYADRSLDCDYYINKGDLCYEAFISRGFTWGGNWKNQKDYQHFQKKLD